MALLYFKYRTDYGNTIIASSVNSFSLGPNEAQIQLDYTIPSVQPLYLYRVQAGNIVENLDVNVNGYNQSIGNDVSNPLSSNVFTGYTGTTAPATFALKVRFNTYTGTTAPATYQSKSSIVTLTGTTLPATYVAKSVFNSYTGGTTNVTTASNGVRKNGSNIRLGGSLTGSTNIGLGTFNLVFTGSSGTLRYGSDLSASYNVRSFVDKGYVTGITSTLLTVSAFNTYSGNTANLINTKLATSAFNTYSGNTANLINTKVGSANNGVRKTGTNVYLGGSLTGSTNLGLGALNLIFTATTGTVRYGADYSANFNVRSLVDKGYVTGITSTLVTQAKINTYTGTTAPNTFVAKSVFSTYTGGTTNVTSASNGVRKNGNNVRLGGSLTGSTNIGLGTFNLVFTGSSGTLRYGSDLSASYNVRSLVDRGYVTGITSTLLTVSAFNTYSGNTANLINTKLATSAFNTYSGNTANLINTKVGSANNGVRKTGTNVYLGGSLTGSTNIGLGTFNIVFTGSSGTLRYGSDLSASYNVRSLVDRGYVTGITSTLLSTSAFNTYSGNTANLINTKLATSAFNTYSGNTANLINTKVGSANNGLTKVGTNVRLGGSLTGATTIDATTSTLLFTGTTGQFNVDRTTASINLSTRNALTLVGKNTGGATRVTFKISATGTTYSDATATGIVYGADYSSGFVPRTLVDKGYVTGITSTLVATAGNGIRKNGQNVRLGGSLTGSTNLGLGTFNLIFTGTTGTLRYGSDLSAQYNVRSLVDKGYVTGTTQAAITVRNSGTTLNTVPVEFTTWNFSSGLTAIDKGSNVLEIQAVYGGEVYSTGRTSTATNSGALADYLARSFSLAGGVYKIEFAYKGGIATANVNFTVTLLVDGVALVSGNNTAYRNVASGNRTMVYAFGVQTLSRGSHSFRLQHAPTAGGTLTGDYGQILITRIG